MKIKNVTLVENFLHCDLEEECTVVSLFFTNKSEKFCNASISCFVFSPDLIFLKDIGKKFHFRKNSTKSDT